MSDILRTLVVDDEEGICLFLEKTLKKEGHTVTTTNSGQEALDILRDTSFDLAIVDLNLGGRVDGIRVLEAVRWRWPATAVIILTAHGSLESAMQAIREGVDGYLLKPAKPSEVRQCIKEALEKRRELAQAQTDQRVVQRGSFFVDLDEHLVTVEGQELELTPQEFKLLVHLMQNAPQVISPPDLVEAVRDYKPEDLNEARQIIKWYIHRLRQRIEPTPSSPRHIVNVRGVGYKFQE